MVTPSALARLGLFRLDIASSLRRSDSITKAQGRFTFLYCCVMLPGLIDQLTTRPSGIIKEQNAIVKSYTGQ